MALLNRWDPTGEYKKTGDYRVYQYEAETIAQSVKSNSKVETVARAIAETIGGKELDENEVNAMAGYILAAVKTK